MKRMFFLQLLLVVMMVSVGFAQTTPSLNVIVPTDNYWSSSTSITFGYEVDDNDCNLSSVRLYVGLIGTNLYSYPISGFPVDLPFSTCGGSYQTNVTIPKGAYVWSIEARDATGKYRRSTTRYLSVQTNRSPSVNITSLSVNGISISARWNGSDPDGDVVQYRTRIDNNSWSSKNTNTTVTYNNLAVGSHTFYVEVSDAHLSNTANRNFTIDQTNRAPSVSLTSPSNGYSTTNKRPSLRFSVNDPDDDEVDCYIYISNSCSPPRSCPISQYPYFVGTVNGSGSLTFHPPYDLNPSLYSWEVKVSDGSLTNWSSYRTFTITEPNTAPYFSNVTPANGYHTINQTVMFGYEVGDNDCNLSMVQLYVSIGNNDPFTNPMPNYPKTVTGLGCGNSSSVNVTLPIGQYRWGIKATDAGNLTAIVSARILYVDNPNQPPIVTLLSPNNNDHLSVQSSINLDFSVYDPEGGQIATKLYLTDLCSVPRSCPMNGYPVNVNFSSGSYSYLIPTTLAPGPYSWEIQGTDNAGSITWSSTRTFIVDEPNNPPIVTIGDIEILNNTDIHVCWVGSDLDNDPLLYRYKLDNVNWSGWSSLVCTNYTNLSEGPHTFYVEVQDNEATGNDQKQFTINNQGPKVTATDLEVYEDDVFNPVITAIDNSGIFGYEFDVNGDGQYDISSATSNIDLRLTDIGEYDLKVKVTANDGGTTEVIFHVGVNPTIDELPLPIGSSVVNFGKVQRYGWQFINTMDDLPTDAYSSFINAVDNLDLSSANSEWKTYNNPKFPNSFKLDVGQVYNGERYSIRMLVYDYDFSQTNIQEYPLFRERAYQTLVMIKDKTTGVDYHFHNNNRLKVKADGIAEPLLPITKLDDYVDGDLILPKVGIINKEGKTLYVFTDLAERNPETWVQGDYKSKWYDLFDPNENTDRAFNMKGLKEAIDNTGEAQSGFTSISDLKKVTKEVFAPENRVIIADAASSSLKASKTLKYLHAGGKVLVAIGIAVSIFDIGISIANHDMKGAICKGTGEVAAYATFFGVTTLIGGSCSECIATAEVPPVAVGCFVVCSGVVIGASVIAYNSAEHICSEGIEINFPGGEQLILDRDVYDIINDELDRLQMNQSTQFALETTASSTTSLTTSQENLFLTVIDSDGNEVEIDSINTFRSSYVSGKNRLHEVVTIFNPQNELYQVRVKNSGVPLDSTFTLVVSGIEYDTLTVNTRFADVPTGGYSAQVHVNQPPYAIFAQRINGIPTVITDTVTIGRNEVFTIYPQLSYDPDGDLLLDYSLDIKGDNIWEISQLTNFSQGIDLIFDTLGVYPIVLRVRDSLKLSGFNTVYLSVQELTGINDELNELPKAFRLSQNYPNPFNPQTVISYNLPISTDVKIDIFNILGERVEILVNKHQVAGEHEITWNADLYSSGIYLYRIQTGDIIETKKMLLLK